MGDGYQTEVGAIRSDAKIWSKAATDIDAPRTTVQSLALNPGDIGLAAVVAGLGDTYGQLRQRLHSLLGGAQKSFNNISTTLNNVATAYENQESTGSGRMAKAAAGMEGS
ncbi:hypothetical protein [Amycolatopsis anabasis]|uniref:hypothetical protein n=1 Tax=Amycolatopsis anabasis TaxID=1840409 RepID=UPI00131D4380|nr:hypothetical protein [Amycolatopsis anabasis]